MITPSVNLYTWIIAGISFLIINGILLFFTIVIVIFCNTMYRNPRKKRTRECTNKKDQSQVRMFAAGEAFAEQYKDITEKLYIVNDGLNLYGEYMNFGHKKCAVIIQGRSESLVYSWYFAGVYVKNGYNILTIDVRAHGLSDGVLQTAGIKESGDLVAWIKLINQKFNISDFALHGICIGAATAVYTYIKLKNEGSDLVKMIITDGLYITYKEIFKKHFKMFKRPAFPALQFVFFLSFILTGARLFKETPIKYMKDIDIPFLFIWSLEDIFCIKSKNEQLFQACASGHKELCFFPRGRHSHVRSSQEAEYDEAIDKFLQKHNRLIR